MKHKRFLTALLIGGIITSGVMAVPITACSGEEGIKIESLSLNYSELTIRLGYTNSELKVTYTPDDATQSITWTSSDDSIAKVDSKGILTAKSEGTVTITASAGRISDSCEVTVVDGEILKVVEEEEVSYTETQGTTYYVAPNASSTGKGTEDDPIDIVTLLNYDPEDLTLSETPSIILQAGDTVIVAEGEYNLTKRITIGVDGNYANPITIKKAEGDGKAVLKFYDMAFSSSNRGVSIYGDYIVWDEIDVAGAGDNGMYVGGSYNTVVNCEFYDNRDTGLQLGRSYSRYNTIDQWPSYNLIKNCTSYNNYDNETYGENADGFAAKLTVGYGNIFDGCIAYRNSDDGWDLYAKLDSGNIGAVIIYNCVAFENGFIMETQESFNSKFPTFDTTKKESQADVYNTRDGDGNGFKLGGSVMEGEVILENCLSFHNRMHGVTDNSNPGVIMVSGVTAYNNAANVDNDSTSSTYGQIVYDTSNGADDSANIDLARQTYSYNHIKNVISVKNDHDSLKSDNYRGTVENSLLQAGSYSYQITDVEEYDTKVSLNGEKVSAPSAKTLFKALPTMDYGISYSTGYDSPYHYIDDTCRNSDGSINMGDLLAFNNESETRGAHLNSSNWDAYTHWELSDLSKSTSKQAATAQAIADILYLPLDETSCFQDFQVTSRIWGYPIFWSSSDSSILSVSKKVYDSNSDSCVNKITVNRPADADATVTLTAQINVGGVAVVEKKFTIVVKQNTFKIGDISVPDVEDDQIITELGDSSFSLQDPVVVNGASESGQIIDSSLYDVATTYAYKDSADGDFNKRPKYTGSAGIWKITLTITLKDSVKLNHSATSSDTYSYLVYVASASSSVDFSSGTEGLYVNKDGFTIYGEPSNPTGIVYVLTKEKGATAPTADEVVASGTKTEFRTTSFTQDYEHSNDSAYNVYYVVSNSKGSAYSSVHSISVATKDISTKSDFENMLASNNASTIYRLVKDIDCQGSLTVSTTSFVGLFNGMGHTIKNVTITNTSNTEDGFGIFCTVKNGTIENVTFENITVNDTNGHKKTGGVVGLMYGGTISRIKVKNVKVTGSERVGGVVGQVCAQSGTGATTTIDNVELINPISYSVSSVTAATFSSGKYYEKNESGEYVFASSYVDGTTYYERSCELGGARVGGIVGFIQAGSSSGWNVVTITNCYVQAALDSSDYCGGIIGRSDDRNAADELYLSKCYVGENTVIYCYVRGAGILGGFTGTGITRVTNCIALSVVYYGKDYELVTTAQKNSSGLIGNYAATADCVVEKCVARYSEYNSDYDSSALDNWNGLTMTTLSSGLTALSGTEYRDYWQLILKFDATDSAWEYVTEDGGKTLASPYMRLK